MNESNAWKAGLAALICLLAVGCGTPGGDNPETDAGTVDGGGGEEDAGRCPADDEWFDEEAMACASCAVEVSCGLYDEASTTLSFDPNELTVALTGLPYPVEELTLKGEQVLYVCGGCPEDEPDCADASICPRLESSPYAATVEVSDGAFTFALQDPDFNGVELTSFEWTDPCGAVQQLTFVGEWDYDRWDIKTPIQCTEE